MELVECGVKELFTFYITPKKCYSVDQTMRLHPGKREVCSLAVQFTNCFDWLKKREYNGNIWQMPSFHSTNWPRRPFWLAWSKELTSSFRFNAFYSAISNISVDSLRYSHRKATFYILPAVIVLLVIFCWCLMILSSYNNNKSSNNRIKEHVKTVHRQSNMKWRILLFELHSLVGCYCRSKKVQMETGNGTDESEMPWNLCFLFVEAAPSRKTISHRFDNKS